MVQLAKRHMLEVKLPCIFKNETMFNFMKSVIDDELCPHDAKLIVIDFSDLYFIEPSGVAVLSNTIDWLKSRGVRCQYRNANMERESIRYLDDSEFFKNYGSGNNLFLTSSVRDTTIPLSRVRHAESFAWLEFKLVPWLSGRLSTSPESFVQIRGCIKEIFNNIKDHSGEDIGCVFAQHYPHKDEIVFVISDFGIGIPRTIERLKLFDADEDAIYHASQEGVSSKSVQNNMGIGLNHLIQSIVKFNKGRVNIYSGFGRLLCKFDNNMELRKPMPAAGYYPGTFVEICMKTDTIDNLKDDQEEIDW